MWIEVLEVKLPTVWTYEAEEVRIVSEEKEPEKEDQQDQGSRKGRKVMKRMDTPFFHCFVAPERLEK